MIEVLHAAQGVFGFLETDLLIYIATALRLPFSRVYGVATFYHVFRMKPNGEHTFVLCTGTACYVKGAAQIQQAVEECCKTRFGQTSDDKKISLVSARCVGSCGLAPVAVVDDAVAGRVTVAGAVKQIREWQRQSEEVAV